MFNPVCLPSNFSVSSLANKYQSACHAGCHSHLSKNQYTNCKCLNLNATMDFSQSVVLSSDNCSNKIKCKINLVFNCIAAAIVIFFTAFALIPQLKTCLSTVDIEFQPFALGIRAGVVRIVGNFSGSLIVGKSIDETCKYWLSNCFGQKTCKIYYNKNMSVALAAIGFSCRFMTALLMFAAFLLIRQKDKKQKQKNKVGDQVNQNLQEIYKDKDSRF